MLNRLLSSSPWATGIGPTMENVSADELEPGERLIRLVKCRAERGGWRRAALLITDLAIVVVEPIGASPAASRRRRLRTEVQHVVLEPRHSLAGIRANLIIHWNDGDVWSCRGLPRGPAQEIADLLDPEQDSVTSIAAAADQLAEPKRLAEYDIALSFAGEDRVHAERLAQLLRIQGITVFYDADEKAELWGKDLYQHLSTVYRDRARYCVIFISIHYRNRRWTRHELQAAQARAFADEQGYILPLRLDDAELPGVQATTAFIDLRTTGLEEVSELLRKKLDGAKRPVIRSAPPRPRRRHTWRSLATLAVALISFAIFVAAAAYRPQSDTSLPYIDGGTWIHVHRQDAATFAKCTTAFTVVAGSAKYVVTAKSCLPPSSLTITTANGDTGSHDAYTFATNLNCATSHDACIIANSTASGESSSLLDVAAFKPEITEPSFRIQADAGKPTVPVIGPITVANVLARGGDRTACHFGLGSSEHSTLQAKQCGRLAGILPSSATVNGIQAGGLGELDAYGNNDGDLGGPVYVFAPDDSAVYILGMVVSSSGACDLDGCHGKTLFVPIQDIERALGARLYTSS